MYYQGKSRVVVTLGFSPSDCQATGRGEGGRLVGGGKAASTAGIGGKAGI